VQRKKHLVLSSHKPTPMKFRKTAFLALVALIAACSSRKKSTAPTVSTAPAATVPSSTTVPLLIARSGNGVYPPGNEELTAIQVKYPGVTLQTLTEGHAIYTGACTNCHGAKSIYSRPEEMWPGIMDNMAPAAKISESQKDAVLKYVMAIKATQPKGK
jgi:mono/diheme cytochrome c family protein